MKLYYPNAVTVDGKKLFTTDAANSAEQCCEQFDIWENHYRYKIKEAWCDKRTDDGILRYHCQRVWKIKNTELIENSH